MWDDDSRTDGPGAATAPANHSTGERPASGWSDSGRAGPGSHRPGSGLPPVGNRPGGEPGPAVHQRSRRPVGAAWSWAIAEPACLKPPKIGTDSYLLDNLHEYPPATGQTSPKLAKNRMALS
jgi:hypothetical protein